MGYMVCMAPCVGCHQVFSFNPERVPSVRIRGSREPICRECVNIANPVRLKNGLEPIHVLPGAYEPEEC
jgi:hypothetical protein